MYYKIKQSDNLLFCTYTCQVIYTCKVVLFLPLLSHGYITFQLPAFDTYDSNTVCIVEDCHIRWCCVMLVYMAKKYK